MKLRRALGVVAVLAAIEGVGFLVDARWPFRSQLLKAFDAAAHPGDEEEASWHDPGRLFAPDFHQYTQVIHFRGNLGADPFGQQLAPGELPTGKRIFVLGESAAFGVGVQAQETFSTLLDERLQPRGSRVINAGQQAATPWQVLDAGAQLLTRYGPAELVLFTGNNQWFLWSPPQQRGWSPWAVRILSVVATSRAIAGLEFLMIRQVLQHRPKTTATFQDHRELTGSRYALQFPLEPTPEFGPADWLEVKQFYLRRFETSLEVLVRESQKRQVKVVLVTVPFNHRLSPNWKHPQFEAFDPTHATEVRGLVHEAGKLAEAGDCVAALPKIEKALGLDPMPPVLHYLRGECLEKLGRLDEAEAAFAQSREHMMGNLGSRLSVNEIIRKVATNSGVPLVDAAKALDDYEHQHGQHFSDGLFVDDCHLSPLGHKVLAEALEPVL